MASVDFMREVEGGRIYSLKGDGFPENSYIVCSASARDILYRPYLAGMELQEGMKEVGKVLVRAMGDIAIGGTPRKNLAELVYLSGGLFYGVLPAFKKLYGFAIPQSFIGIQRFKVDHTQGDFVARATYQNFEALPDDATIIIGDTIATGATMSKGLELLSEAYSKSGKKLDKIVVCTLAGSPEGLRALHKTTSRMKASHPTLKVYFFACEQLFTLMPDGTDLRFLETNSIMPEETRKHTLEIYGDWLGKNMKCAVFDWGTRCKNPVRHYQEFAEYAAHAVASAPSDSKQKLLEMKEHAESGLKMLFKPL